MAIDNKKNGMNRCPKCGSTETTLNVKTGNLKCEFCRAEFKGNKVNAPGGISELKGDIVGSGAGDIIPDESVILTLKCPACGAEVVINTDEATSARCHWCRHNLSVNEKMPNGAVPDLVLPFKTEKKFAEGKIDEFVNKRKFFAHPTFTKEFNSNNVLGVYLPYMIVQQSLFFVILPYTILQHKFFFLFDTENCVEWNPSYLRGYASEKRDTNVSVLKPAVEIQSKDIARYQAKQTMKFYDRGVKWTSESLSVKGTSWKAAYLPVWLYSYYQTDKKLMHYVAVNARTGETMGSVPINKTRLMIVSAIVEVIGVVFGLWWFKFWIGVDVDDDNPAIWGFLGFTPGFIFYWIQTSRYRNMGARHKHEQETKTEVRNLKQSDVKRESRKRLSSSRIAGENGNTVRGTLSSSSNQKMLGEKLAKGLGIDQMLGKK